MHRFYVAPNEWNPDAPSLSGSEAHHAGHVLRLETGDKVVLFNGCGREITAEIISSDVTAIRLRKLHEARTQPLRCRIIVSLPQSEDPPVGPSGGLAGHKLCQFRQLCLGVYVVTGV